jgi:hypothetical protein
LRKKLSIFWLPRPSPLTSMMYNFLITNTIAPTGIPVSLLIIFSVWNKTLSLIRERICHVIVLASTQQYRERMHKGNTTRTWERRKALLKINANHSPIPFDIMIIKI